MSYLSLKIFKEGQLLKTKIFTDDQISVGSSDGLSLKLEGIAPWHLLIEKKHDIFCILDLNSEMGTKLNGHIVTGETPISSGSVIHVGPYVLEFYVGPPVKKPASPQAPAVPPQAPAVPPQAPAVPPQAPSQFRHKHQPFSFATSSSRSATSSSRSATSSSRSATSSSRSTSSTGSSATSTSRSTSSTGSSTSSTGSSASSTKSVPPQAPAVPPQAPAVPPQAPAVSPQAPAVPPQAPAVSPQAPAVPPQAPAVSPPLPEKPIEKALWGTYAPPSKIKNLDDFMDPSIGNLIEVIVCWKERVLSVYHFFKSGNIFMGVGKDCQVKFPNMLGASPYKLLSIASGAKIYLSQGVKGLLFQGKDKKTRTQHPLQTNQSVVLKPYEMVKLEFNPSLKVYVRLMEKSSKPPFAGLLNLRLSEALALFLAFLLTGLLVFYGSLYAPAFLAEDTKFIEKNVRVAKVVFKKPPKAKVVEYKMGDKTTKAQVKSKPKVQKKRPTIKAVKKPKKKSKPMSTPKKGKQGKMAAQAPGKKKPKSKKVTVGSVRPGGSLKTGKKGSSAKTVAPDPTKVGLLGAFGGGGQLNKLDKGASGSGGLLGLAQGATGYAGTEEAYQGEGIGTKTKDLGSGGQGSALVGISGIKTKGKGLGKRGTGEGGLGKRGRMNIEFGTDDIDVAGEIDRDAILQALRRNQSKFQRCYQGSLNQKPSIQGNLGMQWLISPSGQGRTARAFNNQIGSDYLANCVARVLESVNFSEPPSGQTPKVTFTFKFYL